MQIRSWFRKNPYGQFTYRMLLAVGSAIVTVALAYVPYEYDTILQAIWVVFSSLYLGYLGLRGRLNETDDARYRRLFRGRFEYLEKANPEALTTIFADNVGRPVMQWFESEYKVPITKARAIDALDSLSRNGDQPGQLIFRVGVELGQWLKESEIAGDKTIEFVEAEISQFIDKHENLLGEEVVEGIFFRHVKRNQRRPVGIHMFHPKSKCLFTVEDQDFRGRRQSIALSAKAEIFSTDEEWEAFKAYVHQEFPYFQPARGGSGPQKKRVPLFVVSGFDFWDDEKKVIREKLKKLVDILPAPAEENESPGEPPAGDSSQSPPDSV